MIMNFEVDELIRIAKRENNTKRSYLYVNPIQGKHIPVSPSVSITLFSELAKKVENRYKGENILIIGFAETATAIGSAIAYKAKNCRYYLNTTREDLSGTEFLFFTESHSHATEQRLVINGLGQCLNQIDRIVFAEDEVTTGSTIEKLICVLRERYPGKGLHFGIISILNSMPEERIRQLQSEGIICDFLYHIPVQYRVEEINNHIYAPLRKFPILGVCNNNVAYKSYTNYWNSRIVESVVELRKIVDGFVQQVINECAIQNGYNSLLVLGTEEFMFPGMLVGKAIEDRYPNLKVRFHATTRSPIEVCDDGTYPLHNRMPLESIYGKDRRTFIYNLCKYDRVLIFTDAEQINSVGLDSVLSALSFYGNDNFTVIHWGNRINEKQLF